jgi:cation:H+ antiporter
MDFISTIFERTGATWWMAILFIIVGFVALIYSADLFVEHSSRIAKFAHIPEMIIGLTIVAMGTSMPEAAVSITSALQNNAGIAIGNITGSNIFNILFILGLSAMMKPLVFKKATLKYEMPFLLGVTVLLVLYAQLSGNIDSLLGIIFLILFAVYLTYLALSAVFDKDGDGIIDKFQKDFVAPEPEVRITGKGAGAIDILLSIAFIVVGIFGVIIASSITVVGSAGIAEIIGIPDRVIGVTIVAAGTSLPELVTSVIAIKKGNNDLAIGNIVGSNIFNILFILGITALVSPTVLVWSGIGYLIDGIAVIIATVLLLVCSLTGHKLSRREGILFICVFAAYIAVTLLML